MFRHIFVCGIFFLCGCALQPKYYSYDYTDVRLDGIDIDINSTTPYGVTAFLDVKEVELVNVRSQGHQVWCNGKRSIYFCDGAGNYHPVAARIKRDSQEHELRLKRPRYQDIVFRLSPQYTDELWAEGHNEWFGRNESNHWHMIIPYNTGAAIAVAGVGIISIPELLGKGNFIEAGKNTGISIIAIPVGLVQDIYNIIIGIPSVYIINPWTNYKLDINPLETPVEWVK